MPKTHTPPKADRRKSPPVPTSGYVESRDRERTSLCELFARWDSHRRNHDTLVGYLAALREDRPDSSHGRLALSNWMISRSSSMTVVRQPIRRTMNSSKIWASSEMSPVRSRTSAKPSYRR